MNPPNTNSKAKLLIQYYADIAHNEMNPGNEGFGKI